MKFSSFRADGGYEAMAELLALPKPPDAVLVANNLMTAGALEALLDKGIAPPEIGLAGFDDVIWSRLIRPELTVVRQPSYLVGQTAAQLLLRRLADPNAPIRSVKLPSELEIRASSLRPTRGRVPSTQRRL